MSDLSVVIPTWGQTTDLLERTIWTLQNQTRPPLEIVIVDGGPTDGYDITALSSPTVRVIQAHIPVINLAHLFNIGIKRSRGTYIMTTGNDRLFSQNFLEAAAARMNPNAMVCAPWGLLSEKVKYPEDLFADWRKITSYVIPSSTGKINPGTIQIVTKAWHEKVHGFDETLPYYYIDSGITGRAKRDGLHWPGVPYAEAQVLHQWHPSTKVHGVESIGLQVFERKQAAGGIVRNPNGWGELPSTTPLPISFILVWKERDINYLRCTVRSLCDQTVLPAEIVVVDEDAQANAAVKSLCDQYPRCTYIHAPHPTFNLSWGFNVGIKRTVGDFIITCGAEFVFSKNWIEFAQPQLSRSTWLYAENAPIPRRETEALLAHPNPSTDLYWPKPFTQYPRGLHRCGTTGAHRDWWLRVHGWNEDYPFACSDGEVWERIAKDGLKPVFIGIDSAQIFHLWHHQSGYLSLDKHYFETYKHTPVVANPEKWGEL